MSEWKTRREIAEESRRVFSNAPEFKESEHPRGESGQFGPGSDKDRADPAIVNIPLSKRGDIDKQIDKYKAEQKKKKDSEDKEVFSKRKEARKGEVKKGKDLLEEHGQAVVDFYSKKTGKSKADIRALVKEWSQYYPDRLEKAISQMNAKTNSAKVYRARK